MNGRILICFWLFCILQSATGDLERTESKKGHAGYVQKHGHPGSRLFKTNMIHSPGVYSRKLLQGAGAGQAGAGLADTGNDEGQGGAGELLMAGSGVKIGGNDQQGNAGNDEANDGKLQKGVTDQDDAGVSDKDWGGSWSAMSPTQKKTSQIQATLAAMGFSVISEPEHVETPNYFNVQPRVDEGLDQAEYEAQINQNMIFPNGTATNGPSSPPRKGLDSRLITDLSGNIIDTNVAISDDVAPGPQLVWLGGNQLNG